MRQEQGTGDVSSLQGLFARIFLFLGLITLIALLSVTSGRAAPYAAVVMDARTGEVLYSQNATARLHPASLTKMLTLYIAFDAIKRGEISLDTVVTVSKNAASKPPSRLGLKAGQKIALRYLIRAAAVKSANDAASAIGDALSGSESAFAARMTRTAKAIGMKNSTFKNANGLTEAGHLSTAADMNHLGRRLFYDFPQYYNIFSRRTTDAGMANVRNTNRRFLDAYRGADGIKTGYTSAAGFNLTASAERGSKRIIATVFGGKSTAHRNAKMAELMDIGFGNAPANAKIRKPEPADLGAGALVADGRSAGKTIRLVTVLQTSPRPRARPGAVDPAQLEATAEAVLAMQDSIEGAIAVAANVSPPAVTPAVPNEATVVALSIDARPAPRPAGLIAPATEDQIEVAARAAPTPAAPPGAKTLRPGTRAATEVVTRMSTSGGRHWGVNLGRFPNRSVAERVLMKTALTETVTLQDGLRKVVAQGGGYDANFMGLTREQADLACRRLQARAIQCFTIGP
ncbi:MAG: D-alanyl-D-alanine carboxypeptidase [Pseudorhodobacter sp.]|nr:D-alanyl-D-alanine carboxypeptidase [Pseudorhodobacter sp.]